MFFNQIAFLPDKELISWPGLMSPRKTFTPKTHYSTVKHNEITPSALSTKKTASSNPITAIRSKRKFLQDRTPQNLKKELLTNYRHKQTSE